MHSDTPPEALIPLLRWPAEQQRRRRIGHMLGPTEGLRCLDMGGADGGLGWFLRQTGGDWSSVEPESAAREELESLLGTTVHGLEEGRLPFEDETFDAVVAADRLESMPDPGPFIRECHRVLKPAGRLILHVTRSPRSRARSAPGESDSPATSRTTVYSESDLFAMLKDGFDVQEVQGYGRFFSETADQIGWHFVEKAANPGRAVSWAHIPVWAFSHLDGLLFFTRGRRWVLRAKRRLWIPRNRPVLRDGRSIAEATLKTRIGTASPLAAAKRNP